MEPDKKTDVDINNNRNWNVFSFQHANIKEVRFIFKVLLGHLSHLLWVGVRRCMSCVVCHPLTSFSQES